MLLRAFNNPSGKRGWSRLAILAAVLPIGIGLISLRYGLPSKPGAAPLPNVTINPVVLTLHAVPAALTLIAVPFQLHPGFRARHWRAHRRIGRAYVGLVFVAGPAALWIAPSALGGAISAAGFTTLALGWMTTTALGLVAAIGGRLADHHMWMTRSAALALSAATLRMYLLLASLAGADFVMAYRVAAWGCWVPNLIVAEWWLRARGLASTVS
ncbi:DUF2306 domain-containing protein [Sphingomonas sanguinis]|uniref:DUF2306 domain-containing protein n=1 Tax=Sphingomonas sanguinis TaxID=33051 RepID=UPI001C584911|nr:DUF2306 domain-containing protein [Sphingomonas sanguinis]QXT35391.1 DUF2306 domain-containing protein [Sphingomonas sanguinis]